MINTLKNAVYYSTDRVSIDNLCLSSYISTENLIQNKLGKTDADRPPPKNGKVTGFIENDILVGNIRPYLKKIWYADISGGSSADVLTLRVNDTYIPKFVYYALFRDEFFVHMMNGSKGTKMPRGDKTQILDFPIPFFEKNEQKKIARFFSLLDKKMALNNKINTDLEAMAKLIYDYWFVQFDFPDANGNPYKSSGGKMVYNEALKREIPEGWGVGTLLDVANFTNGIACQKYRPSDGEDGYKVIKIREMGSGFTENSELVSRHIPEKVVINNGDVLFSWSATLDVKIWADGIGGLNQHIFKITSNSYPRTYYYFETLGYLQHFKMIAELRKTTMGHITQDHLKQSRIPIAPNELVDSLHLIIDPIISKVVKAKEENQKLIELRDWLLPMLMNGQVTVKYA